MKTFLLCSLLAFNSIEKEKPSVPSAIEKLQLDNIKFLTDKNGLFLPLQFFEAPIGSRIKIYRTDGFCYEGMLTHIEKTPEMYKILGVFDNCEDSGFGIAITKNGAVAGTILERKNNETFSLEHSSVYGGWVFVKVIPKKKEIF